MRITEITLHNYRAFYGTHSFNLDKDGKNLMVYGENGSGKSSLYEALKKFMVSSVKKVKIEEHAFIPNAQKNTGSIKLKISDNTKGTAPYEYELKITEGKILGPDITLIANANKIKGFFDYRSLLETHLNHTENVNIFKILNENILPHAENRFTNREIREGWELVQNGLQTRKGRHVVAALHTNIDKFSKGFKYLIEKIQADTNTFLMYFDKRMNVTLEFDKCYYQEIEGAIYGEEVNLKIRYAGKLIERHQLFLNEARLSALAISLYLASIKLNPLTGALKVLVLDDLLIGLDMSNRLPLLQLLQNHFINPELENEKFQVIMTTYDKIWFEVVNNYFGTECWKYVEIYSKKLIDKDFDFPVIKVTQGYLDKAKHYLGEKDNKAAAVYIRTEFERIVKSLCEKKMLQVNYKSRQKEFTTEDFWDSITNQTDINKELVKEIEIHRSTVMNPFSHYDMEHPEFTGELQNTIISVEKLGQLLVKANFDNLKKKTFKDLEKQIEKLEMQLKKKEIGRIIHGLLNKK